MIKPIQKIFIKIVSFLTVTLLIAGITGFQNQGDTPPSRKKTTDSETIINKKTFTADSTRAFELYTKARKATNTGDWNAGREYVQESIYVFDKLIEQTSDSLIWEEYVNALFDWAMWNGFHYQDLQDVGCSVW